MSYILVFHPTHYMQLQFWGTDVVQNVANSLTTTCKCLPSCKSNSVYLPLNTCRSYEDSKYLKLVLELFAGHLFSITF